MAKYSRGHEKEADDFGIQLAASAGYKTDALADALDRLSKEVEVLTGESEKHNYFSDHPYTPSRISNIRGAANLYKPVKSSPICSSQNKFINTFHGLCFGPNPEQGMFIDSLFIHPTLSFSFLAPSGWLKMNKPTMVTTYSEAGDALLSLRMMADGKTPRAHGEEVKEKLLKAGGITLQQASDTTLHALAAYAIRFMSKEKNDTAFVDMVWVDFRDHVYQLVAIANPAQHARARTALYSFKHATDAERQQVRILEMQVVSSVKGETWQQYHMASPAARKVSDYFSLLQKLQMKKF